MKEQPKDKFPITVKKGHAAVKIYRVKNREARQLLRELHRSHRTAAKQLRRSRSCQARG